MKKEQIKELESPSEVRAYIFKLMEGHLEGSISTDMALTQHKLVSDLLESVRLEIKAVELSASINTAGSIPLDYQGYVAKLK